MANETARKPLQVLIPEGQAYWLVTQQTGETGLICGHCHHLSWDKLHVARRYCSRCGVVLEAR